ncbi:MAG: response regulator [Ignavibacteriota bacterium]
MAQSGKEALRHLLNDDFAAILLDVRMPEMDGFETAELIRGGRDRARFPSCFSPAIATKSISSAGTIWAQWISFSSPSCRRSCDRRSRYLSS